MEDKLFCQDCETVDFNFHPIEPSAQKMNQVVIPLKQIHVYPSLQYIIDSASKGCVICGQISGALHEDLFEQRCWVEQKVTLLTPIQLVLEMEELKRSQQLYVKAGILSSTGSEDSETLAQFEIITLQNPEAAIMKDLFRCRDRSLGSKPSLRLANFWLRQCLESHELCTLSSNTLTQPLTRVLDVNSPDILGDIKLVNGEDINEPYVILSHVWGKERIITTSLSTLTQRTTRIPFTSLPKTFQEAVAIVRDTGYRYLWIDSLCIIQDLRKDWEIESTKMGHYYRQAVFTIAAVSAKSDNEGCFLENEWWYRRPIPLDERTAGSIVSDSRSQKFLRPSLSTPIGPQLPRPSLEDSGSATKKDHWMVNSLDRRGWVVQETLLSPRILRFSIRGMSWTCLKSHFSDRTPEKTEFDLNNPDVSSLQSIREQLAVSVVALGTTPNLLDSRKPLLKDDADLSDNREHSPEELLHKPDDIPSDIRINSRSKAEWTRNWYLLVELYTKCQLTVTSDILPAISGLARQIASFTGDNYLVGLWEGDLERGLLWQVRRDLDTAFLSQPAPYRGPTWSWVSVISYTGVYFSQKDSQYLHRTRYTCCELGLAEVDVLGRNPFGEVAHAVLNVRGFLKSITVPPDLDYRELWEFDALQYPGRRAAFHLDTAKYEGLGLEVWLFPILVKSSGDMDIGRQADNSKWKTFTDKGYSAMSKDAECLVLVSTSELAVYARVGVASMPEPNWFHDCEMISFKII